MDISIHEKVFTTADRPTYKSQYIICASSLYNFFSNLSFFFFLIYDKSPDPEFLTHAKD